MTLVEPRQARAGFLELVVERLDLKNVRVIQSSVDGLEDEAYELAFARAFVPFPQAWSRLRRHLVPGGRLVYFAGTATDVPSTVQESVSLEVLSTPVLATSGPLIIIGR